MLGDVKFHEHRRIDPEVAESWRQERDEDFLGEPTWRLAEELGYRRPAPSVPRPTPLVPLWTRGEGRPLFLVHPVGGGVFAYNALARHLGRPVYGLQSLGLVDGEPQRAVEEMAAAYAEAIAIHQPEGPWLLGGWSVGGAIAWEVARCLRERGGEVPLLVVLDGIAPGRRLAPELDAPDLLAALARDLQGLAGTPLELPPLPAGVETDQELDLRLDLLVAAAARAGALPPGLTPEAARRLLRVFRANLEAVRAYEPAPHPIRLVLVRTETTQAAVPDLGLDPALGWSALTPHLEVLDLGSDHYSLLQEPEVEALAAALREPLEG
jgi:thioesterase domain-containing protein